MHLVFLNILFYKMYAKTSTSKYKKKGDNLFYKVKLGLVTKDIFVHIFFTSKPK